jgi:hypothetical protein
MEPIEDWQSLQETLEHTEAQEEYWKLSGRLALAQDGLQRAERAGEEEESLENSIALLEAQQEHTETEAAMDAFRKAHDGESFRVFRPEHIEAMVSPDIEPLWTQESQE